MLGLLHYAKKYRKECILGPFFKFLEACFELVLPLLMARLIDQGVKLGDTGYVIQMSLWMLGLSVIGLGCVLICQYYASIASQGFGTELRNALLKKINTLSYQELNHFGTDTLITRLTGDINQLQLALAMLIRLVIRAPFLSIGSIVMAFTIRPQIGLLFLLLLPIFCLVLFIMIRTTVPLYKKVQVKMDQLNRQLIQSLEGVRVIRAFARQKTEEAHVADASDDLARTYIRVTNLSALLTPATTLIVNAGILVLLYLSGQQVNTGLLQQGEVLALINYMTQMLLALIIVANLVVLFTRAAASANRINEVFAVPASIQEAGQAPKIDANGSLTVSDLSFRYTPESGDALQGINFRLETGQTLGITGPTGSGKSTLLQLLPRFYDATQGVISCSEVNVNEWSLQQLRKDIVLTPQTAVLFTGTIRQNLQWGKRDASDEECWRALRIAQCHEFVQSLPDQLDTHVFEGGKNFSGGQKQRLTIARSLIAQPKILLLDDSLSALDYRTDLNLRTALREELVGTTVIIVSQRISSIQDADQILVLDEGRQVATGTHAELLSESPVYRSIVQSQAEEEVVDV